MSLLNKFAQGLTFKIKPFILSKAMFWQRLHDSELCVISKCFSDYGFMIFAKKSIQYSKNVND